MAFGSTERVCTNAFGVLIRPTTYDNVRSDRWAHNCVRVSSAITWQKTGNSVHLWTCSRLWQTVGLTGHRSSDESSCNLWNSYFVKIAKCGRQVISGALAMVSWGITPVSPLPTGSLWKSYLTTSTLVFVPRAESGVDSFNCVPDTVPGTQDTPDPPCHLGVPICDGWFYTPGWLS